MLLILKSTFLAVGWMTVEKLGFINSAKEWLYFRKLRNEISHTYDDEPQEMTQVLNNIVNQKEIIKKFYLKFKIKYGDSQAFFY